MLQVVPATLELFISLIFYRICRLIERSSMTVSGQDIVVSAKKLLGARYRTWYYGASLPMWLDDNAGDPPPLAHLQYYGVMCSDLVNWALEDNGLPPGGGTYAFADYLVNTSDFDPSTPGVPGAIALSPYQSPAVGEQGHIAIYVDEGHTLIQALTSSGITDQFTDTETYNWGGDTAFTTYGFLPGVSYEGGSAPIQPDEELWRTYGWYEAINAQWDLRWHSPKG
jgi:hypothetical protein